MLTPITTVRGTGRNRYLHYFGRDNMEKLAEQTADKLRDEIGADNLVGVSYYGRDGVGHVFRSDWAEDKYDPEQVDAIVDELRLEALGHCIYEQRQEQSLHATIRVYDDMLDVAVPVTETEGIAFALDIEGDYSIRSAVECAEEAIEQSDIEQRLL